MPEYIQSAIASIISGIGIFLFQKFFEGQIARVTPNEKNVKAYFWVFLFSIMAIVFIAWIAISHSKPDITTTNVIEAQKTDVEAWTETGQAAVSEIKEIAAETKRNRDEKRAAKAKKWVYQIGDGIRKIEDAVKFYKKLTPIGNIYLFEKSNKEFYLIQSSSSSEQELRDNLDAFQEQIKEIPSISSMIVTVVDLNDKCSLNEFITLGEKGKMKKKKYNDVNCFICQ